MVGMGHFEFPGAAPLPQVSTPGRTTQMAPRSSRPISGRDWAEEIAQVQLAIKDLDLDAEDYEEQHAELRAELRRLRALPVEAPRVETTVTDRSEGDVFGEMSDEERRAYVRLWTLTVWPKGHEALLAREIAGNPKRWLLTRGRDLNPAEVDKTQLAMLEGLKRA
jgi:hypothetical protein